MARAPSRWRLPISRAHGRCSSPSPMPSRRGRRSNRRATSIPVSPSWRVRMPTRRSTTCTNLGANHVIMGEREIGLGMLGHVAQAAPAAAAAAGDEQPGGRRLRAEARRRTRRTREGRPRKRQCIGAGHPASVDAMAAQVVETGPITDAFAAALAPLNPESNDVVPEPPVPHPLPVAPTPAPDPIALEPVESELANQDGSGESTSLEDRVIEDATLPDAAQTDEVPVELYEPPPPRKRPKQTRHRSGVPLQPRSSTRGSRGVGGRLSRTLLLPPGGR